jgi:cell division protein FtsB
VEKEGAARTENDRKREALIEKLKKELANTKAEVISKETEVQKKTQT